MTREVIRGMRHSGNVGVLRPANRTPEPDPAAKAREVLAKLRADEPSAEAEVEAPPETPSEREQREHAGRQERLVALAEERGLSLTGSRPHEQRTDLPKDANGYRLSNTRWNLLRATDPNTRTVRQLTPQDGVSLDVIEEYLTTYPAPPSIVEAIRAQEAQAVAEARRWIEPRQRDPYGMFKQGVPDPAVEAEVVASHARRGVQLPGELP